MTPEQPVVGEPSTFTSIGEDPDGTIVKYAWDFGDGNKGTGANITHTYTVAGDYTVRLTVVDDHGISSSNKTTTITVIVSPS